MAIGSEEKIPRRPSHGDIRGVADGSVVGILNGTVGLDVADSAVATVLDCSIFFDMPDGGVIGVLYGPVSFQMADRPVVRILHCSVRLDVADNAIRCILNSTVGFDMCNRLVTAVGDALGVSHTAKQEAQRHQEYETMAMHY